MTRIEMYVMTDALKEALYNAGCFGERKEVKFALAQLTTSQRNLLIKLAERQNKRARTQE